MTVGHKILKSEADPLKLASSLISFKSDIDTVVLLSFENNKSFQEMVHNSFTEFMNTSSLIPHYLCMYANYKLQYGYKKECKENVQKELR